MFTNWIKRTWSKHIQERLFRVFFSRLLGKYVEGDYEVSQLLIDFNNGALHMKKVSLIVDEINEALLRSSSPFLVKELSIGEIQAELPWGNLWEYKSKINVRDVYVELDFAVRRYTSQVEIGDMNSFIDSMKVFLDDEQRAWEMEVVGEQHEGEGADDAQETDAAISSADEERGLFGSLLKSLYERLEIDVNAICILFPLSPQHRSIELSIGNILFSPMKKEHLLLRDVHIISVAKEKGLLGGRFELMQINGDFAFHFTKTGENPVSFNVACQAREICVNLNIRTVGNAFVYADFVFWYFINFRSNRANLAGEGSSKEMLTLAPEAQFHNPDEIDIFKEIEDVSSFLIHPNFSISLSMDRISISLCQNLSGVPQDGEDIVNVSALDDLLRRERREDDEAVLRTLEIKDVDNTENMEYVLLANGLSVSISRDYHAVRTESDPESAGDAQKSAEGTKKSESENTSVSVSVRSESFSIRELIHRTALKDPEASGVSTTETLFTSAETPWLLDFKSSTSCDADLKKRITGSLDLRLEGADGAGEDVSVALCTNIVPLLTFLHMVLRNSEDGKRVFSSTAALVMATHEELWRTEFSRRLESSIDTSLSKISNVYFKLSLPTLHVVAVPSAVLTLEKPQLLFALQQKKETEGPKAVLEVIVKMGGVFADPYPFQSPFERISGPNGEERNYMLSIPSLDLRALVNTHLEFDGKLCADSQVNMSLGAFNIDIGAGSERLCDTVVSFASLIDPIRRTHTLNTIRLVSSLLREEKKKKVEASSVEESIYYSILQESISANAIPEKALKDAVSQKVKKLVPKKEKQRFLIQANLKCGYLTLGARINKKLYSGEADSLYLDLYSDFGTQFRVRGKLGAIVFSRRPFCGAFLTISSKSPNTHDAIVFTLVHAPPSKQMKNETISTGVQTGNIDVILDSKNECFDWPKDLASLILLDERIRETFARVSAKLAETRMEDATLLQHAIERTIYTFKIGTTNIKLVTDLEWEEKNHFGGGSITLEGRSAEISLTVANRRLVPPTVRISIASSSGFLANSAIGVPRRIFYTGVAGISVILGKVGNGMKRKADNSITVTVECPNVHIGIRHDSLVLLISFLSHVASLLLHFPPPTDEPLVLLSPDAMSTLWEALGTKFKANPESNTAHAAGGAWDNGINNVFAFNPVDIESAGKKTGQLHRIIDVFDNQTIKRSVSNPAELFEAYSPEDNFFNFKMTKIREGCEGENGDAKGKMNEMISERSKRRGERLSKSEDFRVNWNIGSEERSLTTLIVVEEHEVEEVLSPSLSERRASIHVAMVGVNIQIDLGGGGDFTDERGQEASGDAVEIFLGDMHVTFEKFLLSGGDTSIDRLSHIFTFGRECQNTSWVAKVVIPRLHVVDRVASSKFRNMCIMRFGSAKFEREGGTSEGNSVDFAGKVPSANGRWKLGNDIQLVLSNSFEGSLFLVNGASVLNYEGGRGDIYPREALQVNVLLTDDPFTIHLDQDTLEFLTGFAAKMAEKTTSDDVNASQGGAKGLINDQTLFFQSFRVTSFNIALNYSPKHIRLGWQNWKDNGVELLKSISLTDLKVKVPSISLHGMHEPTLLPSLFAQWRSRAEFYTLVTGIAKGVGGVGSVLHVGEDAVNVVIIPIKELSRGRGGLGGARALSASVAKFVRTLAKETGVASLTNAIASSSSAIVRGTMKFFLSEPSDEDYGFDAEDDVAGGRSPALRERGQSDDRYSALDSDSDLEDFSEVSVGSYGVAGEEMEYVETTAEYDAVLAVSDSENRYNLTAVPINLTDPLLSTLEGIRRVAKVQEKRT